MKYILVTSLVFSVVLMMTGVSVAQSQSDNASSMSSGDYSITSGNASMSVNPRLGARILSLKLGRFNFLVDPEVIKVAYGSTFWPSPQSDWNWPPPAVLDTDPYTAVKEGDTITFVSGKDNRTGLQVTKKFYSGKDGRFNLVYSMKNIADTVKKVAPWEITRVRKGGLLFFPVGHNPFGKKYFDPAPVNVIDGIAWYKDGTTPPPKNLLTTAEVTQGWAAYVIDGRMFLKKFPNVPRNEIAPGEGDVDFYVSSIADYVEFEIEGKYRPLAPGAHSTWHVEWILVHVPKHIKIQEGNHALVEFVRGIVNKRQSHR